MGHNLNLCGTDKKSTILGSGIDSASLPLCEEKEIGLLLQKLFSSCNGRKAPSMTKRSINKQTEINMCKESCYSLGEVKLNHSSKL